MTRASKILTLVCLAAFALVLIRTAWVRDDVYFTLRTVDNFINGYGLRWNIAERVALPSGGLMRDSSIISSARSRCNDPRS